MDGDMRAFRREGKTQATPAEATPDEAARAGRPAPIGAVVRRLVARTARLRAQRERAAVGQAA
jgi:hypothetical protein